MEMNSPRQPVVRKVSNVRNVKSRFKDAAAARAAPVNRSVHSSGSNQKSLSSSANLSNDIPSTEDISKTNSETKLKARSSCNTKPSTNVSRALYKNKGLSGFSTLNDKPSINKMISNSSGNSSNSNSCSNLSSGAAKSKHGTASASPYKSTHVSKKRDACNKENTTPSKSKASNVSKKEYRRVPPAESSVASKLHSTAMNATLLNTTVQLANTSQFSSTVVSQRGRGCALNLPELPDISAIKLDLGASRGAISETSDGSCEPSGPLTPNTILSLSNDVIAEETEVSEESREVTPEELELLYLQYLTWCHVTASAAAAHTATIQPALKELRFLEELVAGKEKEEEELKQKLQLMQTVQRATEVRDALMPALSALNDSSDDWCDGMQSLSRELEHHLNHLTLSPAILPDTPQEVVASLNDVSDALSAVLQLLPPCTDQLTTATSVLSDARTLSRCNVRVQEAACSALQNCSLQLAAHPSSHAD